MKPRHISSKGTSKRRKQGFEGKPERPKNPRPARSANAVAIQLFEPDPGAAFSIERTSQLAQVPRRRILIYCKQRLVSPITDPDVEGYWFDAEALRTLKRIEELRAICDEPLTGVKVILDLMREVQRLRAEMRALDV
jgi:hypothetical protein